MTKFVEYIFLHFEEGDVPMLSPAARKAAADRRHGADEPDVSNDFPGHSSDQLKGQQPQAVGGQVQGDANRPPQGVAAPITNTVPIDNRRLRNAVESLMTAFSMPIRAEFIQHLDQLVLAADAGHEVLSDMIDRASKGEDPAPP